MQAQRCPALCDVTMQATCWMLLGWHYVGAPAGTMRAPCRRCVAGMWQLQAPAWSGGHNTTWMPHDHCLTWQV